VYSTVYSSDTASECVLQELLRAVGIGVALSWRIAECLFGIEYLLINPVVPPNSGRSSDWYNSSVYYGFG